MSDLSKQREAFLNNKKIVHDSLFPYRGKIEGR